MGDMSKEPSMEEILSSIKRIIAEEGDEGPTPRGPRRGRLEVVPAEVEDVAEPVAGADDDILELTPPAEAEAPVEELAEAPVQEAETAADDGADETLELTPPTDDIADVAEVEAPETDLPDLEPEAVAEEIAAEEVAFEEGVSEESDRQEFGEEAIAEAPEYAETEASADVVEETAPVADEVLELTNEIETEDTVSLSNAATALSGSGAMISVESEVAARHSLSALSSMIVLPEAGEGNTLDELVKAMLKPMLKEWLDARLPELVETMVAKEISRITGGVR